MTKKELKNIYLVWVGGVYNQHDTKIEAVKDYLYWIQKGYTDLQIQEKKITL